MQKITYALFEETYKPTTNHLYDNASYNNTMFETYDDEHQFVLDTLAKPETSKCVWTVIGDAGSTVLVSGYHIANRLGYMITELPLEFDYDVFVYDPDLIVVEGDVVYWAGGEDDRVAGDYTVVAVFSDVAYGEEPDENTKVKITNDDGISCVIVEYWEIM